MNPLIIVFIFAASFGVVATIAAFVRQLILSRDKNLNDQAQSKVLQQQADELKQMREQLNNNSQFAEYEKALSENRERIKFLDTNRDEILQKKLELLIKYNKLMDNESGALKESIKAELDKDIILYDKELERLQQQKEEELKNYNGLNELLVKTKATDVAGFREISKQHASLIAKNTLRSIENTEHVAIETIAAGTSSFQSTIMAPINFLIQYFSPSAGASIAQVALESATRYKIAQIQNEMHAREIHAVHFAAHNKESSDDAHEEKTEDTTPSPSM